MATNNSNENKEKKPSSKKPSTSTKKTTSTTKTTKKASSSTSTKTTKAPFSLEQYKKLNLYVDTIMRKSEVISIVQKDKTIQETLAFFINAIYTYEQAVKPKKQTAQSLKGWYDAVVSTNLTLNKIAKDEIEELDDKINFLPVYIHNSTGLDFEALVSDMSTNKKSAQQNMDPLLAAAVMGSTAKNLTQTEQVTPEQTNFNASDFMRKNNISMDQIADTMIEQKASAILWSEIANGTFYRYKSKPSFFIWIKWALFVVWILSAIALLVFTFYPLALGNTNTGYILFWEAPKFNDGGDIIENPSKDYFIMSPFGLNIMSAIFSLMAPACIIWYAVSQVRNYQNENSKYTCKTFISWILLIFLFQIISIDIIKESNLFNFSILDAAEKIQIDKSVIKIKSNENALDFNVDQLKMVAILKGMWISQLIFIALNVISIILSIMIIVIRPKQDFQRMKEKLELIKADIKNGTIDLTEDDGGAFGGRRNPFSSI